MIVSLLIPGVGPVVAIGVAGGVILGALGAVGGGALGGKLEGKVFEGLPEDELYVYEDALRKGRSVVVVMAEDAQIGYMPARVWGCPTTAMWVYRLGPERAKRMLLTGDKIDGREGERIGLVLKAVPADTLNEEVEKLAEQLASVPVNQLMMQKLMINQALENMGLRSTQMLATIFDGITRHSPEGLAFKHRAEAVSWKRAVKERDLGTYDWTADKPINRAE